MPELDPGFSELHVGVWRQFSDVRIKFHDRLTVLTGANGSGKTTLLNILGKHFNWLTQYLAVPLRGRSATHLWSIDSRHRDAAAVEIGSLTYSTGVTAPLIVGPSGPTYDIGIQQQQFVHGLFISSHRTLSGYQSLSQFPAQFSTSQAILDQFTSELRSRYAGGSSGRTPMYQMKEALIAAAIFGEETSAVERNPEAAAIWEGFQRVLKALLPSSLGFASLRVRPPDILLETSNGEFLIDAVSGGLSAIIELAWQIFLRSQDRPAFTVCIDEPENHLHPSLQRALIPSLLDAFPRISFVVATHSPFIVTSVSESFVYVLDYEDEAVVSRLLDTVSKAATSDETLRRVLGLETTAPLWVERAIDNVLQRLPERPTAQDLLQLRSDLQSLGLGQQFPAALAALTDEPRRGRPDAPAH